MADTKNDRVGIKSLMFLLIVGSVISYALGILYAVSYHKAKDFTDGNCTVSNSNIHEQTIECNCGTKDYCTITKSFCVQIFVRINEDGGTRLLKLYQSEKDIGKTCFIPLCDKPSDGYNGYVYKNYPIGKTFSCSYSLNKDEAVVEKKITSELYLNLLLWPSAFWVIFIAYAFSTSTWGKKHLNFKSFVMPLTKLRMHYRSENYAEYELTQA